MNKTTVRVAIGFVILFTLISGTAFAQNAYIKICLAAIDYEKEGKLDEAIAKYGEAITLNPEDWTGYNYRAKLNLLMENVPAAIKDISKAISLSPQTLSLYKVRADCYKEIGIYDKAIADYNMALSKENNKDKELYLTYLSRGVSYFYNGQYRESINDLNQSITLAQKAGITTTDINLLRAKAYLNLNKYPEAIDDFDIYLTANPFDMKALFMQGYSYFKNGENENAKTNALNFIKSDPVAGVRFSDDNIMEIYELDLRREKSKQLLHEAQVLISEQSSSVSKSLANIKLNDAFKSLDEAWIYAPSLTTEDQILKDTIKARLLRVYPLLKTKPEINESVRKYAVQATGATKEKKYDNAIDLWTNTLKISPYYPVAYYNRAHLHEMRGMIRSGISDMETYLILSPDASDARSAKDKIYEWEAKITDVKSVNQTYPKGAINEIQSAGYSAGNFKVAIAAGGSFGFQVAKNPGLEELWSQCVGSATPDYKYTDKMPFLYSGELELTIRPIKWLGIGAFGKLTGGIGARTNVSGTKYMLNMGTAQYGGLVKAYFLINDGQSKPDVYVEYAFGQSKLNGDYSVATMDGIIYNYSYTKEFKSTAPYHSFGVGMGGKLIKHSYMTLSLNYIYSEFKDLTYSVITNTSNTGDVGTTGTLDDVNATYNGFVMKLLFGFCF